MERLVVFLAILAVSSGCSTTVSKDFVFDCPAPNNKGLQAVFEEFSALPKDETLAFLNSSSMSRIGKLFIYKSFEIVSSPEYEKLLNSLCENAFVDSISYADFFWWCMMYSSRSTTPKIPDSELRADFLSSTSELHQTEVYRTTQEILSKHIPADPYAQLGMEFLHSEEIKQILKDVLSIPVLKPEVDQLRSVGVPVDEVIEMFAYAAASIWTRYYK